MNIAFNIVLISTVYYGVYKLFLSQLHFFKLNRWVLLTMPLLCMALPILGTWLPANAMLQNLSATVTLPEIELNTSPLSKNEISNTEYLFYAYCLISFTLIVLNAIRLRTIFKTIRSATLLSHDGIQYLSSQKTEAPFSFLQSIVLPQKNYAQNNLSTILKHEAVHCKQHHSIDNLYFTVLTSIAWFNPFFHLMAKELRKVHECLADAEAIQNTSRAEYAQMLLSQTLGKEVALPALAFFNSSLIKTRITMMYKTKTNPKMKWSYLLLVPALALTTLYSCSKQEKETKSLEEKAVNFSMVDEPPLFESCDAAASVDEKKKCFQKNIMNTVAQNFTYPKEAEAIGLEGKVFVGFIINDDGKAVEIKILRGLEGSGASEQEAVEKVHEEAMRVVGLIEGLEPAKTGGNPVAMSFTLPINLKLPKA